VQRTKSWIAVGVAAAALCAGCGSSSPGGGGGGSSAASSGSIGPGITKPATFAPFRPSNVVGPKPNLPAVLGNVQDSPRGFEQELANGLRLGARDAQLQFRNAESNGDPQTEVQDMQQLLVQGVGALFAIAPLDPTGQANASRQAIEQGVDVGVNAPGTSEIAAPQYRSGQELAELAASYVKAKLHGKADVVILNQDSVPAVRPRFQAMRDVLRTMPGVKIVADVEPALADTEHGFQAMTTVIQKVGHVDVVLGADAVVEGALAALQAAHQASPEQFLAGVDCEAPALADIVKGGPYKACIGDVPTIFGYAWARFAGDWLAGKSVPSEMCVRWAPVTNAAQARQYVRDEANPAAVFNNSERLSRYLGFYGNISYATRRNYLAFYWSPSTC
jgi:ribose transport system substrate-binding protein